MKKDYAYGIIPLMEKDGKWYTILIHLSSGNHRWLPKWHGEIWETALQSAMRELHEETWLVIDEKIVNTTQEYKEQYHCISHGQEVDKTVLYYTAIIPYTDVTKLSGYSEWDGEILNKKITTVDEAINCVTYDATRNVLKEVKKNI
jgi:8-oxo-dGTP pyrophosphatase MutT (NUDIX family)